MPFVVPRIAVPTQVNSNEWRCYFLFEGRPTETAVEVYIEWLEKELVIAKKTLEVMNSESESPPVEKS